MALFENKLKAVYYGGFEDNHEAVKRILIDNEIKPDDQIWLLWLPHKPISNSMIQKYGGDRINIEAEW
ncbi:hypothetical protein E24_00156 [Faustovirus]|nr:hypothetical protein PRJ_Fausto_00142 [Faustovirus]AMN83087.1 hypothetical protein E24_00156 [Faustovirus]AMN84069.1 hypothetical protein D5a_00155 [Faustovirus]AMN85056.1 hypothetical protein E23_00155 [Faustovirus]QBR99055.1 hypothetical protein [Faustovirus mariensis]